MANYAENRKARFKYELLEKFEAGLSLSGSEVKGIKAGKISLDGSYVIVANEEAYLKNALIRPHQESNLIGLFDVRRPRKLLLNKAELIRLSALSQERGLTIVPVVVYNKAGKVKIEIAVARGKKLYDKRETLKKKALERDLGRKFK